MKSQIATNIELERTKNEPRRKLGYSSFFLPPLISKNEWLLFVGKVSKVGKESCLIRFRVRWDFEKDDVSVVGLSFHFYLSSSVRVGLLDLYGGPVGFDAFRAEQHLSLSYNGIMRAFGLRLAKG